jgi:hypothetical protein
MKLRLEFTLVLYLYIESRDIKKTINRNIIAYIYAVFVVYNS